MQGVRYIFRNAAASGLVALACLAAASSASAANDAYGHDVGGTLPSHLSGERAVVHYTTRPDHGVSAITDEIASQVLAAAERSQPAIQQQFGFPALLADPDGKTDVYIWEWPINGGDAIAKSDNPDAAASSGYIKIDSSFLNRIQGADSYLYEVEEVLAHELGHLFQNSVAQYQGANSDMRMFSEGTAVLISGRVVGAGGSFFAGPPYGVSLNDPEAAYASWLFFESLVTDQGPPVIPEIFQQFGQGGDPIPALEAVLARRGSSLAAAYSSFAVRYAAGAWSSPVAAGQVLAPPKDNQLKLPKKNPKKPVDLRKAELSVNHLSTGLVQYGPGRTAKKCKSGKLAITVELPPGASPPTLVTRPDATTPPPGSTRSLALKGNKAVAKVPWAACRNIGTVVLPNSSVATDGQRFIVSAEFTPPK